MSKLLSATAIALSVALAALVVINSASAANIIVQSYEQEQREDFRALNKLYLEGVKDGLIYVNVALAMDGKQPYFCLFGNLGLTVEQAEDIMLRYVKDHPQSRKFSVNIVLMEGLSQTFPCKG